MKQRRRIYSVAQRSEIWDRWQAGEPMSSIGRVRDRAETWSQRRRDFRAGDLKALNRHQPNAAPAPRQNPAKVFRIVR